jgi:site-specific DNA recombinase
MATARGGDRCHCPGSGRGWAGGVGGAAGPSADQGTGAWRFAVRVYGRVSTEDWQDPVMSRARQRELAGALVRGHGQVVAEFFDVGESRTLVWGRRPQAAALAARLAGPDRGWDAIVVGEYERAFYGSQYAAMAPLFEHYGGAAVDAGGGGPRRFRVRALRARDDGAGAVVEAGGDPDQYRVRTAMAVQAREQGRYLGGRPPYGYRLADAGPNPNKAGAAWVGVPAAWTPTRRRHTWCGGSSSSGSPGIQWRGSRGR